MPAHPQAQTDSAATPETVAAIDLGSNSFHMIVARIEGGHMRIIDRLKEMVRLGEGLTDDDSLDPAVAERALACLSRFGQRLRGLPPGRVRAIGTNTLRQISAKADFPARAETALGHPIDIVSGREEARLIYLGIAHDLAGGDERRLVVDIGGGSTEVIVGAHFRPRLCESLNMGCVNLSRRYFADGRISSAAMRSAELHAALEIRPVRELFRKTDWHTAIGSSGTIRSIAEVCQAAGWCEEGITASALGRLRARLIEIGKVKDLDFDGLSQRRQPVFAGGVAALAAIFDSLAIERMQVSDYALREGVIYEMIAERDHGDDVCASTVRSLSRHFHIDQVHAARVAATAAWLHEQVADDWALTDPRLARSLSWAARLHEIGIMVAHSQYQKHGAYLLRNADLPGFSRREQALIAILVLGHRRRFPAAEFTELPEGWRAPARRLCILLRLATLLHRGRSAEAPAIPRIAVTGDSIHLTCPPGWTEAHPLNRLELKLEAERLAAAGLRLTLE